MTTLQCCKPTCENDRIKMCSACLKEGYCSSECQKKDWKIHKILCPYMKNDKKLIPYAEVHIKLNELLSQVNKHDNDNEIQLLEYLFYFAEYQYGDSRVVGKSYHERDNIKVYNFPVDLYVIYRIGTQLAECYFNSSVWMDKSNAQKLTLSRNYMNQAYHYFQKMALVLEPWRVQLNGEEKDRIDSFDRKKINIIYECLASTEIRIGQCHMKFEGFETAGDFYQLAKSHANKIVTDGKVEEGKKIEVIFKALICYGEVLKFSHKNLEAKETIEECYNMVALEYNPTHPMVLKSANYLVELLIHMEDYYDAERYARISYGKCGGIIYYLYTYIFLYLEQDSICIISILYIT